MRLVVLAIGLLLAAFPSPATADGPKATADPAKVYGFTTVWPLHLSLSAKEFAALEPAAVGFPGLGGPPRTPNKPADKAADVHKGGSFGIEYPWVRGELSADGKTYPEVGLRYKGGGSYLASIGKLRRNFKVDLDRHRADQRFHGLKTLNLNAGAADPTRVRESLAYAAYRAAGVPAPRTAFAELTLTVPGKHDRVLVGTYTLIEQVDKAFLKERFRDDTGLLMKPEVRFGARAPLTYQGDAWEPYQAALQPKREPTKAEAERVVAFLKLVDRGTDEQFRREIGDYLDVDAFLRFLGVTALVVNLDSFFTGGHNAFLYLRPDTNKVVFIPWDVDLAFGGFFLLGSPDQQADLSLTHPYPGEHKLVDRLMAIPEMQERYRKVVRELTTTAFSKERLLADLEAVEKATREPLAREKKAAEARNEAAGFGFPGFPAGPPPDLRGWVDKRLASATAQLDGKSKGTIPAGFQFGGGGAARPRPGEVLPGPARDALRLTPEQKRKFDELQRDIDRRVDELLTEEQRAQWKRMRESAAKGPQGGQFGPPKKGPG
jgi:spore coat protein CotH